MGNIRYAVPPDTDFMMEYRLLYATHSKQTLSIQNTPAENIRWSILCSVWSGFVFSWRITASIWCFTTGSPGEIRAEQILFRPCVHKILWPVPDELPEPEKDHHQSGTPCLHGYDGGGDCLSVRVLFPELFFPEFQKILRPDAGGIPEKTYEIIFY